MSAVHVECLCESECVRGKVDYNGRRSGYNGVGNNGGVPGLPIGRGGMVRGRGRGGPMMRGRGGIPMAAAAAQPAPIQMQQQQQGAGGRGVGSVQARGGAAARGARGGAAVLRENNGVHYAVTGVGPQPQQQQQAQVQAQRGGKQGLPVTQPVASAPQAQAQAQRGGKQQRGAKQGQPNQQGAGKQAQPHINSQQPPPQQQVYDNVYTDRMYEIHLEAEIKLFVRRLYILHLRI